MSTMTLKDFKDLVSNFIVCVSFTGRRFYRVDSPEFDIQPDLHILKAVFCPVDRFGSYPLTDAASDRYSQWVSDMGVVDPVVDHEFTEGPVVLLVEHPIFAHRYKMALHARREKEGLVLYGSPDIATDTRS